MKKLLSETSNQSRAAFIKTYNDAFTSYIKGDWQYSSNQLEKCLLLKPNDGPSSVLKVFIESFNCDSKLAKWEGHRSLESK